MGQQVIFGSNELALNDALDDSDALLPENQRMRHRKYDNLDGRSQ